MSRVSFLPTHRLLVVLGGLALLPLIGMSATGPLARALAPAGQATAATAPGAAVPMDEDLGKLGLDSMASIDLLMEIEQELGVQIPDDMMTADTFSTGNHLLAVIEKLVP